MSDFAVSPVSALPTEPVTPVKSAPDAMMSPAQPVVAVPNPELHLDVKAGLAVIEFRSEDGAVTLSIPSQKQLDAYATGMVATSSTPSSVV